MRLARLATALLIVVTTAAVLAACDGGATTGSPVTGDGRPDGRGGTAALEFRAVLDVAPAGDGDGTATADPAQARERRQSTDPATQQAELAALDCADDPLAGAGGLDPDRPLVACAADGTEKFLLDATRLTGEDVADVAASQDPRSGGWLVDIGFTESGAQQWRELTEQTVGERVAFTVRGVVVSAPTVDEPITGGQTQISGDFTRASVDELLRVITGG